jgi:hypothetical protein
MKLRKIKEEGNHILGKGEARGKISSVWNVNNIPIIQLL